MTKKLIYQSLILVSLTFILFFIFVSVKAYYGGLQLGFLENTISNQIRSHYSLDSKIDNVVLKNEYEKGFFLEINELNIKKNNIIIIAKSINWDFSFLNLIRLSFDKNNKLTVKKIEISTFDLQINVEDLQTNVDEADKILVSIRSANMKLNDSNEKIIFDSNEFHFDTNSLTNTLLSNINFNSIISHNGVNYETEAKYIPNKKQINITKFIGKDFYLNEESYIKIDTGYNIINAKLDINATKNPLIKFLSIDDQSKIKSLFEGFKGWQSIILETNFNYKSKQIMKSLSENLNIKISGIYDLNLLLPQKSFFENFRSLTNYEVEVYNEKDQYVVNVFDVKNDQIRLKKGSFFKFNKSFNNANINLVTSIDKEAIISFLQATILSRENDTARVSKLLKNNLNYENDVILNFNINPSSDNLRDSLKNLYVVSSGKINTNIIFDDNDNPSFISGPAQYYLEIKNLETVSPSLLGNIDFSNTSAFIRQINLKKDDKTKLKINFEGATNSLNDSFVKFNSINSEIDINGKVKITKTNHIFLENITIDNKSNTNLVLEGDLSERILNLKVKGKIIDLSQNKVETKSLKKDYYLSTENYSIITDEVIFAGLVKVNDFNARIEKRQSNLSVSSHAKFNGHELNYSREKNNRHDINIINSSDITYFVNNNHPASRLLSDGEVDMISIRDLETNEAKVKIDLKDFVLINTPASLKLLSLPSISGLVSIAEGEKGIRFGYGEISYIEKNNKFDQIVSFAVSDSLGLIMDGEIDREKEVVNMKGEISPMHLVNAIIQKLPILGPIIVGNEGEGMFSIDFTLSGAIENPDVVSNPLTIIKPRIIERALEALDKNSSIQQ